MKERYEIIKRETKAYWYIWDNEKNKQVCDEDGNPIRFGSLDDAQKYVEALKE